jgi:glutaredoxin
MKIFLKVVFIILFLFGFSTAYSAEPLNAYLFYGQDCPHCAKEAEFLESLRVKYPQLEIRKFEIYYDRNNAELMQKIAQTLNINISGVPFLFIGNQYFIGYTENITSVEIENKIKDCLVNNCSDVVEMILKLKETEEQIKESDGDEDVILEPTPTETIISFPEGEVEDISVIVPGEIDSNQQSRKVNIPLFGDIDIGKFSLPILTMILGFLDGFNPCAMWTLLFLISLLLGMKDRKKMWILGTAFIISSSAVYFIFMAAWLNLILFLGFVVWLRIIIGVVALGGGAYGIKEFFLNKNIAGCKVTQGDKKQRVFEKLKKIINQNSFWLSLGGIIALAFVVNLVELICSAGLPAIYTQILVLNNLSGWQHYFYILFYILFFMLDDLFVFFVAMITLQMTGITTKYSKYSRLIGGILMFIIGLLMIFKPQWLMFG